MIYLIIFILIITGIVVISLFIRTRQGGKEIKNKENTIVYVDHKGFTLSMTQLEKENLWNTMSEAERGSQVEVTKKAIRSGQFVLALVPGANKWVATSRETAEKYGYKIADKRLRNLKNLQHER